MSRSTQQALPARPLANGWRVRITALLFFAGVCAFRLVHVGFANDHFDRIAKGQQILAFGAVPFRDFFDPGFFLTLYSSAAVQALFGHNLAGEAALTIAFIAGGFTCALLLARRLSGSLMLALAVSVAGVLTLPRLYNYDKVLFFPLVLLLCARYLARPTRWRLAALGLVTVIAALYRYDSAVYAGLATAITLLSARSWHWAAGGRALATYAAFVLLFAAPALLFISTTAGLGAAVRQVREYGVREGLRTEIFHLPTFEADWSAPAVLTGTPITVRWGSAVTESERHQLERQYALRRGEFDNGRTWAYYLDDVSEENVHRLVTDARVEDTGGFDRSAEGIRHLRRGVALLPGLLTIRNSAAWLATVLLALPVLAVALLVLGDHEDQPLRLAIAALALAAGVVLLRDPLEARIGDVAAPAVPLVAWLLAVTFRPPGVHRRARIAARIAIGLAATITLTCVLRLALPVIEGPAGPLLAPALATSPPDDSLMPSGHTLGIVRYLRACTNANDRVLVTWFAPEIYYFSGRAFAGGMSVFFGGHWSAPDEQQRTVLRLQRERVPVAFVDVKSYDEFRRDYAAVDEYLGRSYLIAAESSFGDSEGEYRMLVRRGITPVRTDEQFNVPCFR